MATYSVTVSSALGLSQAHSVSPILVSAVTDLSNPNLIPGQVPDPSSVTGLSHSASASLAIANLSVTSYISLGHKAEKSNPDQIQNISQHISLFYEAEAVEYEVVTSYLQLTQSASAVITEPASSLINLTQSAVANFEYALTATTQIVLDSLGTGYFGLKCLSEPFVLRDDIVLTYPYVSPTLTVTLRVPDFGDTHQFEFRRINRRTAGNQLKIAREDYWPKSERLIYNISALTELQKESLLDFIKASLGKEIGLLDFENKQWRGIILTPSAATRQQGIMCQFDANIEFEGVQV